MLGLLFLSGRFLFCGGFVLGVYLTNLLNFLHPGVYLEKSLRSSLWLTCMFTHADFLVCSFVFVSEVCVYLLALLRLP